MQFKWNPQKATKNLRKHKVSFKEAATVFSDPSVLPFPILTTRTRKTDTS